MRSSSREPSGFGLKKNVSCISRAGWPSGMLSLVKLRSSVSMSGPSATAKPMSAKIAVSSSITWLIGWMRPASAGRLAHRQRDVDGLGGEARVERGVLERVACAPSSAAVTRSLRPLMQRALLPCARPASCAPSVRSSAETEPFLPSAATRTASSAASSVAAAMAARICCSSCRDVGHGDDRSFGCRHAGPARHHARKRGMPAQGAGLDGAEPGHDARLRPWHACGRRRQRGLGLLDDRLERRRLA